MDIFSEKNLDVLKDVRRSLIRIIAVCAIIFAVVLFFVEKIMLMLNKVVGMKLVLYSLPEAFMSYLKVGLFITLLIAVPYLIIETARIIAGRTNMRPRSFYTGIAAATLLFYTGAIFCYLVVLPSGIKFLLQYQTENIKPMLSLSAYISFVFTFVFVFGIMFELPLIMLLLGRFGVVNVALLNKQRRFFILANALLSAVLTPTPDVFNMMLMMVPMQVLYELGILVIHLSGGGRLKKSY